MDIFNFELQRFLKLSCAVEFLPREYFLIRSIFVSQEKFLDYLNNLFGCISEQIENLHEMYPVMLSSTIWREIAQKECIFHSEISEQNNFV